MHCVYINGQFHTLGIKDQAIIPKKFMRIDINNITMKTILVIYTNEKLTINKINNSKLRKYAFRIEDNVKEGDILKSSIYSSNMIVTDVIDNDFKYFNLQSGELSNEIKSV